MGIARKIRKKYSTHLKKWDRKIIDEEREIVSDFALKNKKEIRRVELLISKFKDIAKKLNRDDMTKNSFEAKNFIKNLKEKGFLKTDSLDDVLIIRKRDVLSRRLGTLVYEKGLSNSQKQARQFIVHGHIKVDSKVITSPNYLTSILEEEKIEFFEGSKLSDENHLARVSKAVVKEEKVVEEETKKDEKVEEEKEDKKEEEVLNN